MICVSIAEISAEKIISSLKGLKLAEIRMDKTQLSNTEIKKIFSMPVKLVATCRPNEELSNEKRLEMLLTAINSGAAYVDIELESSNDYADKIISVAKKKGCKIIVSYHNYDLTPEANELEKIKEKCFAMGADIAKIACKINSQQDNARIMDVITQDSKVIAIGMGAKGLITRVTAPLMGSPFTYACLEKGKETADGQIDYKTLESAIKEISRNRGKL